MNKRRLIFFGFFLLFVFTGYFLFGQDASFPPPQSIKEAQEALDWRGWLTVAVFLFTFTSLIAEIRPPHIILLISASFLMLAGIITPRQFLIGFSNDILVTIAMLCIIVRAMEVNGLLEIIARKILTTSKNFTLQMLSMCVPVSAASAFLNNTPIVLMMTPIVRRWTLKNKLTPSKFLIPLSYASLFGGACTLIGTSTNLVVHGLLRQNNLGDGFGFFELSSVALPIAITGLVYLAFFSKYLLPDRIDPASAVSEETREFTAEFVVEENCPLANRRIRDAARKYFRQEILIQIERNDSVIDSPSPDLVIFVGDRLVFVADINQIAELHAIRGLTSQADPHFKLDISSSHFSEIVIPTTSLLIGKTLKQINFRKNYGASVLAVYREGWRVLGNVRDIVLQAGDILMMLSGEPWHGEDFFRRDFFYIKSHEKLQVFHPVRAFFVLFSLVAMVVSVILGFPVLLASIACVFALVATRCISIRESQRSVIWDVLLLIACSFSLGRAMTETGVAEYFAEFIITIFGTTPHMIIGGIVLMTIIFTELMTNNAAAVLVFPIAITSAKLAGYDLDAAQGIGVAVAIGASSAYFLPTGYQTHMIVYGPGGYKFTDFMKAGFIMNIIAWVFAISLIPKIWPLVKI